jgi:hypothetical protein
LSGPVRLRALREEPDPCLLAVIGLQRLRDPDGHIRSGSRLAGENLTEVSDRHLGHAVDLPQRRVAGSAPQFQQQVVQAAVIAHRYTTGSPYLLTMGTHFERITTFTCVFTLFTGSRITRVARPRPRWQRLNKCSLNVSEHPRRGFF